MRIARRKRLESFVSRNITLCAIFIYNIVTLCVALIFYPLIPVLMGYPPDVKKANVEAGVSYTGQYFAIILISFLFSSIAIIISLGGLRKLQKAFINAGSKKEKEYTAAKIRSKYINLPYFIFSIQFIIIIPVIIVLIVARGITGVPFILVNKLIIVVLSLFYLASVFSYTFSKKILTELLLRKYRGEKLEGFRIGLRNKIFLQVIPLVVVAVLFTSFLGYSRLIKEKGDLIYLLCKNDLTEQLKNITQARDKGQVYEILEKIKLDGVDVEGFLVGEDGSMVNASSTALTGFYGYYIKHPYNGDRIYGDTEELQGVIARVNSKFGSITVGLRFEVASWNTVLVFLAGFAALIGVAVFILYYFSKSIAQDIEIVAKSINEIAEGKDADLRKRIPVTSNDEIGDLIVAFNRISERENEYDKLRNEFFSNVSHELRTPINIILTTIQFMEKYLINGEGEEKNSKVHKHLGVMKKNGFRLLRVVNNIIDSTKIDVRFFNMKMSNCNIVSLVEDTANSVAEYISHKGLSISFESTKNEIILACDQDVIERAILNLLSNAIKFTGRGGRIAVAVYETGDYACISVKDTGIGIEKGKEALIFERFRQIDSSLTKGYEGSGIGLSLVKSFVNMHGGTVAVHSEYGRGSEFLVKLPLKVIPDAEGPGEGIGRVDNGIEMVSIELSDIN